MMWPDCSPPSSAPRRIISSSTYLSPTGVRIIWIPCDAERAFQSQVRHHGGNHCRRRAAIRKPALLFQVARGQQQHCIAIHDFTRRGTNNARSASPSNATPTSADRCSTSSRSGFQMQRSAIQIDVSAVGRAMDRVDSRAQPLEQFRRERRSRTVGAVGHDCAVLRGRPAAWRPDGRYRCGPSRRPP